MSEQQSAKSERHTGRKIWYGTVIVLSALVGLISIAGILGTWVTGRALSDFTVGVLAGLEQAAGRAQILVGNVDSGLADIQGLTTQIGGATQQVGDNVNEKGVVLTLLPEDRERRLMEKAQGMVDSLTAIRGVVTSAFDIYQAVDRLPFISLPKPATDTVDKLEQASNELQSMVNELAQAVRDFRAGVAGAINQVTDLVDRITERIGQTRDNLSQIGSSMAALQQRAVELQGTIPVFFTILSLVVTLLFIFLLYSQVEVIRLFVGRWRGLNAAAETNVAPPAVEPSPTGAAGDESGDSGQTSPPSPDESSVAKT